MLDEGDRIGEFRVFGVHPGGAYRAQHVDRPQRAVIELCTADDWRAQTMDVLRATSIIEAIGHPGFARIVGYGVLPDHRRWIASELADGLTLSEIIERRRLTPEEAIALVRDTATVLALAHAHGVVHGDLRAHRIIVTCGARRFPLQLGGWCHLRDVADSADEAGDIYALGVLAYRAITGRYPTAQCPTTVAGAPAAVAALILHMLADDPEQRPCAGAVVAVARDLLGEADRARPTAIARIHWTPAHGVPRPEMSEVIELVNRRS